MTPIQRGIVTALALASGLASAAEGDLDLSFDTDGKQTIAFDGTAFAYSATVAAGDAIYLIGTAAAETPDTPPGIAIARLLKNGALDVSFDGDGKVFHQPYIGETVMTAAAVQPDGKLVTAGFAAVDTFPDTDYDMAVCRFETDGTLDAGFGDDETPGCRAVGINLDGTNNDFAQALLIQDDGKIVIAGGASEDGLIRAVIVRLRPDGTTDSTGDDAFGEFGVANLLPAASNSVDLTGLAQASDGKIVAVGTIRVSPVDANPIVFRVDTTGTLDTSLGGGGIVDVPFDLGPPGFRVDEANAVHVLADDSILIAGSAQYSAIDTRIAVAKLTALGVLDTGFDGDGKRSPPFCDQCFSARAFDMTVQPDGRIVLAGPVEASGAEADFGVMRLMPDGEDDNSFGGGGRTRVEFDLDGASRDVAQGVALQNGRVVVAGYAKAPGVETNHFAVARLESSDLIFANGLQPEE